MHLDGKYLLLNDGTGFFSSKKIHCKNCCEKHHKKDGTVSYYHQMPGAVIAHPDLKEVIPICPEPIMKEDGATKNDCERNVTGISEIEKQRFSEIHKIKYNWLMNSNPLAKLHYESGQKLENVGDTLKAFQHYFQAILLDSKEDNYWVSLSRVMRFLEFQATDNMLKNMLLRCFAKPEVVNPQNLVIPALSLLHLDIDFNSINIESPDPSLLDHPLFAALVKHCIIAEPIVEKILTNIRKQTLLHFDHNFNSCGSFHKELALYFYRAEYIYRETEKETTLLKKIIDKIANDPITSKSTQAPSFRDVICLIGSYRPLEKLPFAQDILTLKNTFPDDALFSEIIKVQIEEPLLRNKSN